jgi:hypothetical protein
MVVVEVMVVVVEEVEEGGNRDGVGGLGRVTTIPMDGAIITTTTTTTAMALETTIARMEAATEAAAWIG